MDQLQTNETAEQDQSPEDKSGAPPLFSNSSKSISLESADDNLYFAIMSGDERAVRARLGGSDRMGEAEAVLLTLAHQKSDEREYTAHLAEMLAAQSHKAEKDDGFAAYDGWYYEAMRRMGDLKTLDEQEADKYGGHVSEGMYHDRFGGRYDAYGYRYADGSYKTAGGEYFDARSNTITLADNEIINVAAGLDGVDVLRMGHQIASVLDIIAQAADEAAREAEKANPAGMSPDAKAPATALSIDEIFERAMPRTVEMDDAFRAAASAEEGGAFGMLQPRRALTGRHVKMAQEFVFQNMEEGRDACALTHDHVRHLMNLKEEGGLGCAAQQLAANIVAQPFGKLPANIFTQETSLGSLFRDASHRQEEEEAPLRMSFALSAQKAQAENLARKISAPAYTMVA